MPYSEPVLAAVNAVAGSLLRASQAANLALLVSALLARRTLCRARLARGYPVPDQRRVPAPEHGLHLCLEPVWRLGACARVQLHRVYPTHASWSGTRWIAPPFRRGHERRRDYGAPT